jgi:hypothetical protein
VNTPHPDLETLAELADRDIAPASETAPPTQAADPQTADSQTAEMLAHVAGCAACTADLEALRRVRETLRALPPVPMPADVAERIEAALLAARGSSTPIAASGVADTVVPLRQRSKSAGRSGDAASRWRTLPYGAAASIVVLVAVVVVGIVALGHGGSNNKKSASSPAIAAATTSGGPATIASGTSYTSADLRSQIASVVTSNVPGAASNFPGLAFGLSQAAAGSAAVPAAAASAPAAASSAPAAATAPAPAASSAAAAPAAPPFSAASSPLFAVPTPAASAAGGTADRAVITAPAGPLADPAALARCVQILAGKPEQPLLVDYALFNGAPSTIIVLPDPDVAHKLDIYVEADTANCSNQEFTFETFLGPTPAP